MLRRSAVLLAVPALLAAPSAAGAERVERARPGAAAAPLGQLELVGATRSHGAGFARYRQEVDGVPVLGAQAVFTDAPGTRGDLLVDGTRRGIDDPPAPRVARGTAVGVARRAARVEQERGRARASLAILPEAGGGRLVWRVLVPAREPLASFEVLVDARTGRAVRVRDLLRRETGQASVFDPNPVTTQGSVTGLFDNGNANSAALEAQQREVTLERLAGDCLAGTWARATLPDGPDAGTQPDEVCDSDSTPRDWRAFTRADGEFEAAMAYFHIDRTQAHVQGLGFTNVAARRVRARVNDFAQDNSFYDPATREVSFGRGGVDDAEDAEVIVHEYGHAIQDDQVAGFGESDESGAMGEGFGDYLAAAMSADHTPHSSPADPVPTWDPCFAEWDRRGADTASTVPCLRRLDGDPTAAEVGEGTACDAEVHCAGEAWSSALWDIRTALGGARTDEMVIQSHFSLTPTATFNDGAEALLAANRTLNAGADEAFLRRLLEARGLLNAERDDDQFAGARPLAMPGRAVGQVSLAADPRDVYRLELEAGREVTLRLVRDGGTMALRLHAPGSTGFGAPAAVGGPTGDALEIRHRADRGGAWYVEVSATGGAGGYELFADGDLDADAVADSLDNCPEDANPTQANADGDRLGDACDAFVDDPLNDVDDDGLGAPHDNCPEAFNPGQGDWDRDGAGNLCDRSARVMLDRVTAGRGRLAAAGRMWPGGPLRARAWRLRLERRACAPRGGCRWAPAGTRAGRHERRPGRVRTAVRLPAGRYRLRAFLHDRRYDAAPSTARTLRVR